MDVQYAIAPGVILQETGREGLAFDLRRDAYFALNATATAIWLYLESAGAATEREIVTYTAGRFSVERDVVRPDVRALLTQWARDALITLARREDAV